MKNSLYLHKKKNNIFTTTKDIIVADINKIDRDYEYKKNIFKEPTTLVITGKNYRKDFLNTFKNDNIIRFFRFPVEKVIIDTDFESHYRRFFVFRKVKELEITENCLFCEIYDNLGLSQLENIIIPYSIIGFNNRSIFDNNIKTIKIKDGNNECMIEVDNVCLGKIGEIEIERNNQGLVIYLRFKNIVIKYFVKKQNQEFIVEKQYLKYDISNYANDEILDLIKLKNKYKCNLVCNDVIGSKKIIFSKEDIPFFYNVFFNNKNIKELEIKDTNEMALIPKNHVIKLNDLESISELNIFDNSLFLKFKQNGPCKYIIINKNLNKLEFLYIRNLYFSYDDDEIKFKEYKNPKGMGSLIIPIKNEIFNTDDFGIINDFVRMTGSIYIIKDGKKINLQKNLYIGLANINFKNKNEFDLIYLTQYMKFIDSYIYDMFEKEYIIREKRIPFVDSENRYKKIKKLTLKK